MMESLIQSMDWFTKTLPPQTLITRGNHTSSLRTFGGVSRLCDIKPTHSILVLCLFAVLVSEGCTLFSASHKWDSRIGKYCIHDADRELGIPSKTKKQANGEGGVGLAKSWQASRLFHQHPLSLLQLQKKWSWLSALGSYTTNTPNPKAGQWWVDERKLIFDSDGYLKSWSKREYDTSILTPELSRELE